MAGNPAAEIAIRARRAAFNQAIADGDATAIGPFLAKQVVMLTGSDSAVIVGRAEQVKVWKREFASPARMVYVRTPDRVVVSGVAPIAMEHGRWEGLADAARAAGEYSAKWREVSGDWLIEAELFLTLA